MTTSEGRRYQGIDLSGLPAGFVWGAATAAFQIEGDAEHRGDSIWDAFCREPGRIRDGSDGRVACDHVGHLADDVQLLRDLGVDAYRFSIAWPRVQPGGSGPLEGPGVAFYDRLVDLLLDAGIQPWATLYHWDLPLPLHEAGGWPARDTAARFADYAAAVHAVLGDRVAAWATFNEPWCSSWLGYGSGRHAPGVTDTAQAARAMHHLLLAHGLGVRAMRAQAPADHQLGIVLNLASVVPAPSLPPDVAEQVGAAARTPIDGIQNRAWLDPLFEGHYPADVLELLAPALPDAVAEGDLEVIGAPLDFLGVNYYFDHQIAPATDGTPMGEYGGVTGLRGVAEGDAVTATGWPVTPHGLRDILVRVAREYPAAPPLVVTENGSAYPDGPDPLDDPQRVAYLLAHVQALTDAARDGADLRGYFAWSLMDNFEWAEGYTKRFGLAHVDYATLERRPRRSFGVYRDLTAAQRATSERP